MNYVSSRIPLSLAEPTKRRRSWRPWVGVGLVITAAVGLGTTTWSRAALAERSAVAEKLSGPAKAVRVYSIFDIENDLNRIRADKRLGPLEFDSILMETSQEWADVLAADNVVRHDPKLVAGYQDGWTTLSEGIASGSTLDAAYASAISDQRQVAQIFSEHTTTAGIGLATKDGHAYVVVRLAAQLPE